MPNLRWWIAGLLAVATALNYLDRQSFPIAVKVLQRDIPVSDRQYSTLQSAFLLAYSLMYAGGGRIMDRLGTRAGYAVVILWWSIANFLHGLATSVGSLAIFRFLLGLGEGGSFPGSAKVVSEWFPAAERSTAFGIFNTGSSVGAVIAPPLIAGMIVAFGNWRWAFFATGTFGILWAGLWWKFYALPSRHARITEPERRLLESSIPVALPPAPYRQFFRYVPVWGLMTAKFLTDSAWFFFIFWLPRYLGEVRGLNIQEIGYYAWIPYTFAGVGSLSGGALSSALLRRGFSLNSARKIPLSLSAALMPFSLLIVSSRLSLAIVFFSIALFAHQFWSTIVQTLVTDLFAPRSVGSVAGLLGAVGSFGAMLFNLMVGMLLAQFHGYGVVFAIAGLLHPVSLLIVLMTTRRIERLDNFETESIRELSCQTNS
ncbi:MAG: MFS transporter [Acidobacteriia bacterium]|nr:MFS transporter [Terriglobia bacterium]